jgi:hypothetical protein
LTTPLLHDDMDERLTALLDDLSRAEELAGPDRSRAVRRAAWLGDASSAQLAEFLNGVGELDMPLATAADELLATALAEVVRRHRQGGAMAIGDDLLGAVVGLYQQLGQSSPSRAQLLALLAKSDQPKVLGAMVELLIAAPPTDNAQIVQALAPLFRRDISSAAIFPRLLDALAHPQLAAPIVDLANYLERERLVEEHPASSRSRQLIGLLGELVQSLARLEESPPDDASPMELSRRVASQVALAVSLCDALALIGDKAAIGKLNQALALHHRRLRTEAAAALATLGDEEGAAKLIKLAEEPVARLRVLAYAAELGLTDRIDHQWQSAPARAEAQLAVWLAEPTQFGIPPTRLELFDQRRQFWPGFAGDVECFLFRFTYTVTIADEGERSLSNIGIAGPLAHAFLADMADLPPDDIYAAYAGWQAEHEEIREFDVARLSKSEKLEAERLTRRLHDAGYSSIEPQFMGYFFGDKALVALAIYEQVPGVAVADFRETAFFPQRHSRRPLGPREAYNIYKGRKLLKSFNRSADERAV